MGNLTKEALNKRLFSDPKHYPYGFSRSGDFSIAESQALQQHGSLIAALIDGHIAPENEEDNAYIACALGQLEPQTIAQKAWLKYQKRINRPKYASIHGTRKASSERKGDELVNDIDDDIDIDLDSD